MVRVAPLFRRFVLVFSAGSRQVDHSWPRGGGTGGPHPPSQGHVSVRLTLLLGQGRDRRPRPAAFFSWNFLLGAQGLQPHWCPPHAEQVPVCP